MRYLRWKLAIIMLILFLTVPAVSFGEFYFPKDDNSPKNAAQVMTPPATSPVVTISAAGDVDVSGYGVIIFQDAVTIYWGAESTKTILVPAFFPIGIAPGVTTIHVDQATQMLVM